MTRDQIVAQVRLLTLVEDTNVTDAEIVTLIDNAMQEIGIAHLWQFLQESATISLTAATQTYALPSGTEVLVSLVDDDRDRAIPYVGPEAFFQELGNDTGNTGTTPEFFTVWDDVIYLSPIPSANDSNRITAYYYESITPLANGSASPEFHAAFHPMIVEYCKWKLYEREEYYDQAERSFITFTRYLDQMITWYTRRVKQSHYIVGDGVWRRKGDMNIPSLWEV